MPSPDREHLADLLQAAGPIAPTLDEGWLTRDLLAHLLLREGRPDVLAAKALGVLGSTLGSAGRSPQEPAPGGPSQPGEPGGRPAPPGLGRLAAHADRASSALAASPYAELVERFRSGPPRWSPLAVPAVERAANGVEFYVHGEDVRRAQPGWAPEELRPGQREALWRSLRRTARLLLRRSPVGVVLVVPGGPRVVAVRGRESVVLTGQPEELLLHATGRASVADVRVTGSPEVLEDYARVVHRL